MERLCKICGASIKSGSRLEICPKCYSREYQRRLRAENPEKVNKYQNEYYHKNRKKVKEYRETYTKKNNKTFVYFAVYEDGLYIGSTFWGIQRKSYHLNNIDEKYTQYILNHRALSFHHYDLPRNTDNRYLRLLEAFLINKINPEINMKKMKNHFYLKFEEVPLLQQADKESDEILAWAKTIPEMSTLL